MPILKPITPKALPLLNQSKTLRDSINNDYEKIATYMHLAEFYQQTNQKRALQFANNAFTFAKNVNNPDDQLEALKLIVELTNPKDLKQITIQRIQLSDNTFKARQFAKNQFAKIKYDATKALQEKEKSEKNKQTLFYILIAVATIAINTILILRYRSKQKLKASIYETEIRISKKIHDELANDVFQVMTYAETQDLHNNNNKEILLQSLDDIYARTRDISQYNSQINTNTNTKNNSSNY